MHALRAIALAILFFSLPSAAAAQSGENPCAEAENPCAEAENPCAEAENPCAAVEEAVEEAVEDAANPCAAVEEAAEDAANPCAAVEEAVEDAANPCAAVEEAVEDAAAAEDGGDASAQPEKKKAEVKLTAEAGGTALTGNTRAFTANGLVAFGIKKDKNKFSLNVGANWGRSFIKDLDAWQTTAARFFGNFRYDRFIGERNSVFASVGAFNDKFAGFRLRVEGNIGYSHMLVKAEKHELTGEAGVNYTYEWYVDGVDPSDQHFGGARLFVGYLFKPSASVGLAAHVETVLGGTNNTDARFDGRLNSGISLNAALSTNFAVKVGFQLAYDFVPPEGFQALDTISSVSLVATLL